MHDPTSWTAPDLCSLCDLHATLIREYHCVEGPLPSHANGQQVDNRRPLPPLNALAHMQDSSEDGVEDSIPLLPSQKRITAMVMKNWATHKLAKPPLERNKNVNALHQCQRIDAMPSEQDGDVQSILQQDMPIAADRDDNGKKVQLQYSPLAWLSSLSSVGFGSRTFDNADWSSWFCQVIGMPLPALVPVRDRICACGRHHFDAHGDHVHTCKKYPRNRSDAHQLLLKALQSICQRAGYVATIRNIPESRGQRRADLFVKDIKLAGMQDLVVDVSIIHEFHGDVMQDVRRNGTLCHPDPSSPAPLDSKAKQKVLAYRDDYRRPDRSDRPKAFLPAIMATSGRIQGELLRLLFIISHRCQSQTV